MGFRAERPQGIDFLEKYRNIKNTKSGNCSKKCPKRVWKGPPGLSRSQDGSKLRSESNGMPPGPQNPGKKFKNLENTPKIRDFPISL